MRGTMLKVALCLLAAIPARSGAAVAAGRVGRKAPNVSRPDADKAYSLDDVMKSPKEYLERQVFFYCRFASTANLFKNVNTRFNATEHVNFAVWPDKAVLWEPEGRKNVLPTLYVSKWDHESLEAIRTVKKYELLAVTGHVLNVYARYPWILVTKIERVQVDADMLTDQVIEHMQAGHDALSKNFGGVAARHFEQAIQFGLPCEYLATAYKQLAQAYYLDNQLDRAQDYLRMAVEANPADPLLHLALADVCLRMGDGEEALAHCVFAMERSGRYPQTYGIMGEAKSLSGDFVRAFTDLNAAANTPGITSREAAMVKVRRARIYNRAGRYADAAQVYAAVSEPGEALGAEAWLHNEIGLFYEGLFLKSGEVRYLDSASEAYGEAVKLTRFNDAAILYNQAESEFRRRRLSGGGDYSRVRELIGEINKIEPEYAPARVLEGRTLFAEGRAAEAEARYQTVASLIGDDALALLSLAEAYQELGRHSDAAAVVDRARRLQPWNHRVRAIGNYLSGTETASPAGAPVVHYEYAPAPAGSVHEYEYVKEAQLTPSAPVAEFAAPADPFPEADSRPASGGGDEVYRMDARLVSVRPGESIRVTPNGWTRVESASLRPPEIQASVGPAPVPDRPAGRYPVAEVNLDGAFSPPPPAAKTPARSGALDLGYTPASEPPLIDVYYDPTIPDFEFEQIYGDAGVKSDEALASIPVWPEREALGGALPAFSFEPDRSPVVISRFRAPETVASALPARNANLFRRADGRRQPAEIIEREPAPLPGDASAMRPASDGGVRRAEVRLPSSSRGVGQASDFERER